jgi:Tfp pilus assembly protein PilF
MSSKHRQRPSPYQEGRKQFPATATKVAAPWRWKLSLVFGLGFTAAALWCGVKFWSDSSEKSPNWPATTRTDIPTTRPSDRPNQAVSGFNDRVNRGNQLLSEGKPAEAVQLLTEASQMNPQDEDVHYDLGLALARLGKVEEAIQQYEKALTIFPDYVEAHNNLGNLLMRNGQMDEAIQHFETAIKIMPDYASAHSNLGTALQRTGHTNDALLQFQEAVKIKPDYWEAHFNVGESSLQAGRLEEAQTELETVLRLHPDFQPARAALAEVEARKKAGAR